MDPFGVRNSQQLRIQSQIYDLKLFSTSKMHFSSYVIFPPKYDHARMPEENYKRKAFQKVNHRRIYRQNQEFDFEFVIFDYLLPQIDQFKGTRTAITEKYYRT